MGPAEPCNHNQMTELPGSYSKKLAWVSNTSSQSAWAKSPWFVLQKNKKIKNFWIPWFYQVSNSPWGLNFPIWEEDPVSPTWCLKIQKAVPWLQVTREEIPRGLAPDLHVTHWHWWVFVLLYFCCFVLGSPPTSTLGFLESKQQNLTNLSKGRKVLIGWILWETWTISDLRKTGTGNIL